MLISPPTASQIFLKNKEAIQEMDGAKPQSLMILQWHSTRNVGMWLKRI